MYRILFILLFCFTLPVMAQDSIPEVLTDTTAIDTIVIRATQYKVNSIPRSVRLTNPVISFKKTKPRTKPFKRFRVPSFWEKVNKFGMTISEVAFVNWNAGGNNAVTGIGTLQFERNYKFRYVQWDNNLELRYGLNAQEERKVRKTDDAIRLSSTFGYRKDTITNWYYSVKSNFNTQFANGFKFPDTSSPISRFMAPGYLFVGAGTSYIPEGKKFNLYISPVTQKATFVLDQELANQGAFSVKEAVLDTNGNIVTEGENVFMEFGFLINNTWGKEVLKNVFMKHRISLYTDYLQSFGNIDVDWELNFDFIVNKYIKASIGTQLIFDDDIKFDKVVDANGITIDPGESRIQFRQLLGVGVSYDF